MFRVIASLCMCAVLAAGVPAKADVSGSRLPAMSGYTLDGNLRNLPGDFAAPETLVIVSLEPLSADDISSWQSLAETMGSDIPLLFLVLQDERGSRARAFAAGRLRGKVKDTSHRSRMIAVFLDVDAFLRTAGIAGHPRMAALLVSEDGTILGQFRDPATPDIQTGLVAAQPDRQPQPVPDHNLAAPVPGAATTAAVQVQQRETTNEQAAARALAQAAPVTKASPQPGASNTAFPDMQGYTLAGDRLSIPSDLASTNTRLYILRRGDGESKTAEQVSAIAGSQGSDEDWLALVFMGKSPRPSKAFAAGSLRSEISDAGLRKHVVPVFSDLETLEASMGAVLPSLDPPVCMNRLGATCSQAGLD